MLLKDQVINWIRDYFEENGKGCKAIVGISGGKDSSVVAALCVEALGKENVIGVLMPQGEQQDIDYSHDICDYLNINNYIINIGTPVNQLIKEIPLCFNDVAKFNTPARIRMTVLYAISGILHGRVANTCNLSEDYVGYATKFGDGAGDFSPLMNLTVKEVKEIGRQLKLPEKFIEKIPLDGLCGKTDEDNLGFTYDVLDKYILENKIEDLKIKEKIDNMNLKNLHKIQPMPSFKKGTFT